MRFALIILTATLTSCTWISKDDLAAREPQLDNDGDGVVAANDCDDNNAQVTIPMPEVCDGFDNDCDGVLPENESDADGDGQLLCKGDCDDQNPAVFGGAKELCDDIDNDCDGDMDEGLN